MAIGCWRGSIAAFPTCPKQDEIRVLLDSQFTPEKVEGEVAYLRNPSSRGFERPYGWGWALMLQGELARHETDEGARWAETLKPLGDAFVKRFEDFLPISTYPVRVGVHSNTAFALILALDYAEAVGDRDLAALCRQKARGWYAKDRDCQAWEPSQDEFLSPALIEAACMRRVLNAEEFSAWFAGFLPDAAQGAPATLFEPATVSDRTDGKIAHLDGLNLSRAWCWRMIVDGSGRCRSAARTRRRHDRAASGFGTGPDRRRLYGRALAGELCSSGARSRLRLNMRTP